MKPKIYIPILALIGLTLWFSFPFFGQLSEYFKPSPQPVDALNFGEINANSFIGLMDLSGLKYAKRTTDNMYFCDLRFVVSDSIAPGRMFWMLLYEYPNNALKGFGIFTENETPLIRSFNTFQTGRGVTCIVVTQDDVTGDIVPGTYIVKLFAEELPKRGDMARIIAGISEPQFIDGFLWSARYANIINTEPE